MKKKYDLMWNASLFVISMVTIAISVFNIFDIEMPDFLMLLLGIIDLCAIPMLVYSSVKKRFCN